MLFRSSFRKRLQKRRGKPRKRKERAVRRKSGKKEKKQRRAGGPAPEISAAVRLTMMETAVTQAAAKEHQTTVKMTPIARETAAAMTVLRQAEEQRRQAQL